MSQHVAGALARAFLAGEWDRAGLVARGADALGGRRRLAARVAGEVLSAYHRPPGDRPRELSAFVEAVLLGMWSQSARHDETLAAAHAFAAPGPWTRRALADRAAGAIGRRPPWVVRLAGDVARWRVLPRDRDGFLDAVAAARERVDPDRPPPPEPRPHGWRIVRPQMAVRRWPVPEIPTVGDLAAHLGLEVETLLWLADARGLERTVADEPLRNYRYRWIPRASGLPRLIEQPKARLRDVQRRILREILDAVPPAEAAHGFRRGRSARTHAAAHTGRRVVLRLDVEDFFPSVTAGRVYGTFREIGFPEGVAHLLTALCTNVVPRAEWERAPRPDATRLLPAHHRLGRRLATPHLPQGAPTSPALANLAAFRLDVRLAGLAPTVGAAYTRYADDLAISGDERLLARASAVRASVRAIAGQEGFRVNDSKSRVMTSAGRQTVCGIIVNAHPNLARREYDRLKAVLHEAQRRGPAAANRAGVADFRAHLLGRIAWAAHLNPARGERLRARFEAIAWDEG